MLSKLQKQNLKFKRTIKALKRSQPQANESTDGDETTEDTDDMFGSKTSKKKGKKSNQ